MALKKSFENSHGNTFEYWRVMPHVQVDFAARTAQGQLLAYASTAARKADKRPISPNELFAPGDHRALFEAVTLSGKEFEAALATGDLRAAIYGKIKLLEVFSDAKDC